MTRAVHALLPLLVAGAAGVGCTTDTTVFDPFPIPVDRDAGVLLVGARAPDLDPTGAVRRAVIDTGSPVTLFDVGAAGTTRRRASIELIAAGTGVPRARFDAVQTLITAAGAVGDGLPQALGAVIGGDVLALHALRLDVTSGILRIFPDVAGDECALAESCLGVFSTPLAGTTAFGFGLDSVAVPASRVVLSVCLEPPAAGCRPSSTPGCTGADSLLLVSTAVRPLVLSRSTYRGLTGGSDAAVDALPTTTLYLPGAARAAGTTAHRTTIAGLAIGDRGKHGDDNPARGACLELRASRLMTAPPAAGEMKVFCTPEMTVSQGGLPPTCPCTNGAAYCAVGPSMETARALDALIIEDTDPLLQGLRDELRPGLGDLSGLLGVQALESLVLDLDYPHGRTIARCSPADPTCVVRPGVSAGCVSDVPARFQQLLEKSCFPR